MITPPRNRRRVKPSSRSSSLPARRPYTIVVKGLDGEARLEAFADAGAYRDRLATLDTSEGYGVSIDEIVGLLDS